MGKFVGCGLQTNLLQYNYVFFRNPIFMRTLFTIFVVFGCLCSVHAQETLQKGKLGVGIGTNLVTPAFGSLRNAGMTYSLLNSKPGVNIQVFHESQIARKWSIRFGGQFARSNASTAWGPLYLPSLAPSDNTTIRRQVQILQLSMPLTLRYDCIKRHNSAFFTTFSLQPTFIFANNHLVITETQGIKRSAKQPSELNPFRTQNVSIGTGIGYDFGAFKGRKVFLNLNAEYSLMDIRKKNESAYFPLDSNWFAVNFTVGTYFGGEKSK
jgi:hypothetical protein